MTDTSFKKNQIVTMTSNNSIKISYESVNVNSQVLFQRLVTAGMSSEQLLVIFQYELLSYPLALFDIMKAANKPTLADTMWTLMQQDELDSK